MLLLPACNAAEPPRCGRLTSLAPKASPSTSARIAGFTFLFYIVVAFPSFVLLERARRLCLPLQFAGFLSGPFTSLMWLPMLAFEVPIGLWLLIKGVPTPATAMR